VNQSRNLLRVNAGFLLNQPIGTSRDIHFDYDQIHVKPDLDLTHFTGVIRLTRTPQGILVMGDFKGKLQAECVRCLEPFLQPLHAEFSELYSLKGHGIPEAGLMLPEDANIDFTPLVWEYMNLDIPIKALCRPDCKGLCVVCGTNLNEEVCEHQNYVLEE
jgi:uncharacterized protein